MMSKLLQKSINSEHKQMYTVLFNLLIHMVLCVPKNSIFNHSDHSLQIGSGLMYGTLSIQKKYYTMYALSASGLVNVSTYIN